MDRRTLLRTAAAGIGAATVTGALSTTTANAASGALIMIVRHAEKPDGKKAPYGITPDGVQDSESLTVRGWTRAGGLAGLFTAPATGLAVPTAVYASNPNNPGSQRPLQTASPTAAKLGLTVNTNHHKGDEKALAAELVTRTEPTLVSWQHEKIPAIAAAIGAKTPQDWPDDRYDMVWVFTKNGSGWAFSQIPELLLSGDSKTPI